MRQSRTGDESLTGVVAVRSVMFKHRGLAVNCRIYSCRFGKPRYVLKSNGVRGTTRLKALHATNTCRGPICAEHAFLCLASEFSAIETRLRVVESRASIHTSPSSSHLSAASYECSVAWLLKKKGVRREWMKGTWMSCIGCTKVGGGKGRLSCVVRWLYWGVRRGDRAERSARGAERLRGECGLCGVRHCCGLTFMYLFLGGVLSEGESVCRSDADGTVGRLFMSQLS